MTRHLIERLLMVLQFSSVIYTNRELSPVVFVTKEKELGDNPVDPW